MLDSNTWNRLTLLEQGNPGSLNNVIDKLCIYEEYIIFIW